MVCGQSLQCELIRGRRGEAALVLGFCDASVCFSVACGAVLDQYCAPLVPVQRHVQPLLGLGPGG